MRYRLPSPYRELPHTADVGIEVDGADLGETCARAALAMITLVAGGGAIEPSEERRIEAEGEDRASLLVDFCRRVLGLFFFERLLACELEIMEASEQRIVARAWAGPFDSERHAEGLDIKAVTYGGAALEPRSEGGFRARLIFDI
jgi:SHS2 domain-containing protein